MKRILALIVPLLLLAGCATTPTVPPVDNMQVVAKHAAYDGTSLYLLKHHDQRPVFVTAHDSLVALASTNNPTPLDLLAIIKSLPISQMKLESPEGRIIVGEALLLYDDVFRNTLPVDKPELVTKTAASIAQGINLGLAVSTAK